MIALVAHDGRKSELIAFARRHCDTLSRYGVMATDGTGTRLQRELGWTVAACGHGPSGGDVTVAAAVAAGEVVAVLFFLDPSVAHPHAPDCQALIRQCCVHNVPVALNPSTAAAVLSWLRHTERDVPMPRSAPARASDPQMEVAEVSARH
jgi:methylglyoxal synthase